MPGGSDARRPQRGDLLVGIRNLAIRSNTTAREGAVKYGHLILYVSSQILRDDVPGQIIDEGTDARRQRRLVGIDDRDRLAVPRIEGVEH